MLNRLHLSLAWGRQTGKTRQNLALWRYERYSFMQVMEPIYAIFPKKVPFPNLVIDGVKVIRNLEITTSRPDVNVGTIGHVDWTPKQHQRETMQWLLADDPIPETRKR